LELIFCMAKAVKGYSKFIVVRKIFLNKRNGQRSIIIPKKKIDFIPRKIKLEVFK